MSGAAATDQGKISVLRREAERLEEDAIYSSKGHFNAEDTWVRRHYWLRSCLLQPTGKFKRSRLSNVSIFIEGAVSDDIGEVQRHHDRINCE